LGYWDFDEGQGSVANDLTGQSPSVILNDVLWTGDAPNVFSGPGCQSEDSCLVSFLLQGCTDPDACNFDLEAICDDGNCATCEALQGACGPGTIWDSETSQCVIEEPCGWNPDSDDDSLVGVSDLLMFLSVFGSEWPVFNCGDPVLHQGYEYETVQIGEQCWFAENLRAENYLNGDAIPAGLSDSEWTPTNTGAMAVYDENTANLEFYGCLYNWYAVDDARGLCPVGWHVQSDSEWTSLSDFLGGIAVAGYKMKATVGWEPGDEGSNSSGFSGLPGGRREPSYINEGGSGFWWSDLSGASRNCDGNDILNVEMQTNLSTGHSIRCIKD
jgi:uncharacterized protein (TIGR02145 family)